LTERVNIEDNIEEEEGKNVKNVKTSFPRSLMEIWTTTSPFSEWKSALTAPFFSTLADFNGLGFNGGFGLGWVGGLINKRLASPTTKKITTLRTFLYFKF
jgi:hypothetical protein